MTDFAKATQVLATILRKNDIREDILVITKKDDRHGPDSPGEPLLFIFGSEEGYLGLLPKCSDQVQVPIFGLENLAEAAEGFTDPSDKVLFETLVDALVNKNYHLGRMSRRQLRSILNQTT